MAVESLEVEQTSCEFESGGIRCVGWFYQPCEAGPYPCVAMAHGVGAAPNGPLGYLARRLASEGIAAFTFDYRNFGASDGQPRQLLDISRQLGDWRAAIAYIRTREGVDPTRIGLWGSSLSGGHVLNVAAEDHTVAAVVSQVPYADGFSVALAAGVGHNLRLLPAIARDFAREIVGARPYLIDGLGPPGALAAISAKFPDLYDRLIEESPCWRDQVAARSILQIYRYRPIKLATRIRCPLLVVLSYRDRVAPPGPAVRATERLPYVELALLPARHFDLYTGDARERATLTELQFFAHHLMSPTPPFGDIAVVG